jgi:hypothetical protein
MSTPIDRDPEVVIERDVVDLRQRRASVGS